MKKIIASLGLVALSAALAAPVMAAQVTPASYSFSTSTACGTWCYHDPALSKLTDGVVGNAGWAYNQGQEWVGWYAQSSVNVDFSFAGTSHISGISIGSTQDYQGDVALPSFDIWSYEGSNWVLKGSINNPISNANDNDPYSSAPHGFYSLANLNINSDQVRVTARANGPWIFMDEVSFTSAVPEPETYAMLLAGLGLLGAMARRKNSK